MFLSFTNKRNVIKYFFKVVNLSLSISLQPSDTLKSRQCSITMSLKNAQKKKRVYGGHPWQREEEGQYLLHTASAIQPEVVALAQCSAKFFFGSLSYLQ